MTEFHNFSNNDKNVLGFFFFFNQFQCDLNKNNGFKKVIYQNNKVIYQNILEKYFEMYAHTQKE